MGDLRKAIFPSPGGYGFETNKEFENRKGGMTVVLKTFNISTKTKCHLIDITSQVTDCVKDSGVTNGIVCVHVAGSTGGISTVEFEPGLVGKRGEGGDISDFLEKIAPYNGRYKHHNTWGDGNGSGHVRSWLIGVSQTFPFKNKALILGTWQQIVFCEFDEKPRNRKIYCQIIGQ